jgi:hypothetical protein
MMEIFCFLQIKAEIQANPCNFFDSGQTKNNTYYKAAKMNGLKRP